MVSYNNYVDIINSRKWQRLRNEYLGYHPLCERCERDGRIKPATDVHHIKPIQSKTTIEEMTALAFDANNLMALCYQCHHLIHLEMKSNSIEHKKQIIQEETNDSIKKLFNWLKSL